MKTYLIEIKSGFAQRNKLPNIFVGVVPTKTDRAVYIYGHGSMTTKKTGRCCVCGRELTHPVSVILGIGPQCGGHWWDWKLIGGYSMENIERLKMEMEIRMKDMKVDSWIPRSVIISAKEETEDTVVLPEGHKMARPNMQKAKALIPRRASMIQFNDNDGYGIRIQFPYSPEDVARIKSLHGRRFVPEKKEWTASMTVENIKSLRDWNFEIDPRLMEWVDRKEVNVEELGEVKVDGLKLDLFPFQKRGVAFLEKLNGRGLIADEMGLGKTIQALAYLQNNPDKRPVVIVVPASLKLNWAKEIKQWMTGAKAEILSGTQPYTITEDIAIINYDILNYWVEELRDFNPQVIIADEIHYVKNNGAKRTKALKNLSKGVPHFIGLSGTPIVNRPVEFLNAIRLVDPTLFPRPWDYLQKYCGARHNGYGWDFNGATNTEELHRIVTNSIMIRRRKSEVLQDLPDKIRSFSPVELENRAIYRSAEQDFVEFARRKKLAELKEEGDHSPEMMDRIANAKAERVSNAEVLASIEGLKQLAVEGKMNQAIDWIRNFLDSDQKLVVMAVHKFVIDRLMAEFRDIAVKVDGSVSGQDRHQAVESFQNDAETRLFVGNIKAAGVGLTLTAASHVVFLELPWTPGDLTQAEDRIHRIGQKDACTIHYLLAEDTIEEKIARLLDKKRRVLDSVLDGKAPEEGSLLMELINEYNEEN